MIWHLLFLSSKLLDEDLILPDTQAVFSTEVDVKQVCIVKTISAR